MRRSGRGPRNGPALPMDRQAIEAGGRALPASSARAVRMNGGSTRSKNASRVKSFPGIAATRLMKWSASVMPSRPQPVQYVERRLLESAEEFGLRRLQDLRQAVEDRLRVFGIVTIDCECARPGSGNPVRRRPVESIRRFGSCDSTASQRRAMTPQVRSTVE